MFIIKRNGKQEPIFFDKITNRIKKQCEGLSKDIDPVVITQQVTIGLSSGMTSKEIDDLVAQTAISYSTQHPDYEKIAVRITVTRLHKETQEKFSSVINKLYQYKDHRNKETSLISRELYTLVKQHKDILNNAIDYSKDFTFDYFGLKTLQRSYLMKIDTRIVERPQHMWMRVSLSIHRDDIPRVLETYQLLSQKWVCHATPTLFNAGTPRPQLSSCYLIAMKDDSIEGIYDTIKDTALISKWAGGIGLHVHNIRSAGSFIRGTNGMSTGIVPLLKVINSTCRYVNQGGKRAGSAAIYLEPWHSDIQEFLNLKKNTGDEELRARDLFYALWIPDLFMKRVEEDGMWSLFCPDRNPGLSDVYGDEFEKLYTRYEKDGKAIKTIKAQELWFQILQNQIETGTPYMLYKDHCNNKSNQKNLGTIKSSNLCAEIVEYSNSQEIAVCNLASICLPKYVTPIKTSKNIIVYSKDNCELCDRAKYILKVADISYELKLLNKKIDRIQLYEKIEEEHDTLVETMPQIFDGDTYIGGIPELQEYFRPSFDFQKLHEIAGILTRNLNNIIDINFYPTPETEHSNKLHRPIGIGVQGLADTFIKMRIPFESQNARGLNKKIFETIYHGALEMSLVLAKEKDSSPKTKKNKYDIIEKSRDSHRGSYSSFLGSPMSQGKFQFDMWDETPSDFWEWEDLRRGIQEHGIRNSLLVALMPTASTAHIMGNNECFEAYTSNMYTRRTLAGDFVVVNKHLLRDLIRLGLWTPDLKNELIHYNGSVQNLDIPQELKFLYKTVWEIKQKACLQLARDRSPYICQSQSLNIFLDTPDFKKLSSVHFWGWKQGLKTGMYYLRTLPASQAIQFTVDKQKIQEKPEYHVCESCS